MYSLRTSGENLLPLCIEAPEMFPGRIVDVAPPDGQVVEFIHRRKTHPSSMIEEFIDPVLVLSSSPDQFRYISIKPGLFFGKGRESFLSDRGIKPYKEKFWNGINSTRDTGLNFPTHMPYTHAEVVCDLLKKAEWSEDVGPETLSLEQLAVFALAKFTAEGSRVFTTQGFVELC